MRRIVTKTLAEIYLQQGHLKEADEVLRILSEKDPSDMEIQKKLKELSEKLSASSPSIDKPIPSTDEKIRILKRWLYKIRERRRE